MGGATGRLDFADAALNVDASVVRDNIEHVAQGGQIWAARRGCAVDGLYRDFTPWLESAEQQVGNTP